MLPKAVIIVGLVAYYISWPWRSFIFYSAVATNEGFGTTEDTFIVGVALELVAMVIFSPVMLPLIIVPVAISKRRSTFPLRIAGANWWMIVIASIAVMLPALDTISTLLYCLEYRHHIATFCMTFAGIILMLAWWYYAIDLAIPRPGQDGRAI
jgi:hypothetical protein